MLAPEYILWCSFIYSTPKGTELVAWLPRRSAIQMGLRFDNGFGLTCHFRLFFAMVKIQGTPCMRSHISAHRATTKYFSNSFVFKTGIEKEGLPRDSTPDLGAGGLEFKSPRPDQH